MVIARAPTYCSVEDVAETLDLPDPIDPHKMLMFSNISHPTYSRVEKMILQAEDEIDRRTRRSWRVNYAKQELKDIPTYQWDENGWREAYYQNGGLVIQLNEKDVLPWDPSKGDKLEVRNKSLMWRDVSDQVINDDNPGHFMTAIDRFWFDYHRGRVFLLVRPYNAKFNAVRIKYRYGADPDDEENGDPVPMGINRLATLIVASNIIIQDIHSIKVGMGGDVSGLRDQLLSRWENEINRLYSSYQRSGTVHSLLR